MERHDYVARIMQQGWTLVSADTGFVVAEAWGRYQLTGWFVDGRLGLLDLFDADTDTTLRLPPDTSIPSPSEAAARLRGES